jgi:hypothetical protein
MPDFRPPGKRGQSRLLQGLFVAVIVGAAAFGGFYAWKARQAPAEPPVAAAPPPVEAPSAPAAPEAASYPAPAPVPATEAITAESLPGAVEGLVGRPGLALLRLDDFAHRFTATVDNLARERATASLWPVMPAAGRFTVRADGAVATIAPDNAARYAPYVELAERVDLHLVVGVYRRAYPLLQAAYEALGFPGRPFHARLLTVVDHLLAAPEPAGPLQVRLPNFSGAVAPTRPWVLYEFTDPRLEALSAGQKLMVRVGPDNERRLKARLRELRAQLVAVE